MKLFLTFDKEKMIEKLKEAGRDVNGNIGMGGEIVVNLDDAIEIVEQIGGGTDDVCEWRDDTYGRWHTRCNMLADNIPLEYTYCPYCGRKIKEDWINESNS